MATNETTEKILHYLDHMSDEKELGDLEETLDSVVERFDVPRPLAKHIIAEWSAGREKVP